MEKLHTKNFNKLYIYLGNQDNNVIFNKNNDTEFIKYITDKFIKKYKYESYNEKKIIDNNLLFIINNKEQLFKQHYIDHFCLNNNLYFEIIEIKEMPKINFNLKKKYYVEETYLLHKFIITPNIYFLHYNNYLYFEVNKNEYWDETQIHLNDLIHNIYNL